MINRQLNYIDIARGIGILLVVIGQSITKDMTYDFELYRYLRLYIYTIHMPLFFIIAGYLFENNLSKYRHSSVKTYCKAKIKVFAIPYILFSILNYIIINIAMNIPKISSILREEGYYIASIKESIFHIITYIGHQDNHLWFSYVMLLVLIINRIIVNKNLKLEFYIFIVLYFFAYLIALIMPEILFKTMRYLFIFYIGRKMFMIKSKLNKIFISFSIIANILSFIALTICLDNNISYIYPIFSLITEISASIIIIFGVSCYLSNKKLGYLFGYLGKGKNSYIIYLLHMPFITPFFVFILQKLNFPQYAIVTISTVVSILVCISFYKCILSKVTILNKVLGFSNKRDMNLNNNASI